MRRADRVHTCRQAIRKAADRHAGRQADRQVPSLSGKDVAQAVAADGMSASTATGRA